MKRRLFTGGVFDENSDDQKEDIEGFFRPLSEADVDFDDAFSKGHTEFLITNPELAETKGARLLFFNDHLLRSLELALDEAIKLGCLPLRNWPAPIEHEFYKVAFLIVREILEDVEELSEEWLVLKVYFHALQSSYLSDDSSIPFLVKAEGLLLLGASLRELELVRTNRIDALRGKGTLADTKKGGRTRSSDHAPKRAEILRRMRERMNRNEATAHAARQVARELGMKPEAVRSTYYRYKNDG